MARLFKVVPSADTAAEPQSALLASSKRRHAATPELSQAAEQPTSHRHAVDEEFERRKLFYSRRSEPIIQVAAFLIAVSRQNQHEGRNPAIVCDSLQCGAAADALGLDLVTFSQALLTLQEWRLVEPVNADNLYLIDIDALERLSNCEHQADNAALKAPQVPRQPNLTAYVWSRFVSELRELTWLLFCIVGLSIIGVGTGVIVAMAMF